MSEFYLATFCFVLPVPQCVGSIKLLHAILGCFRQALRCSIDLVGDMVRLTHFR